MTHSDPIRTKDGRVLIVVDEGNEHRAQPATRADIEEACGCSNDTASACAWARKAGETANERDAALAEVERLRSDCEFREMRKNLASACAEVERLKTELSEWQTHERMPHEYVVAGKLRDEVERLRARVDLLQRANGANDDEAWGATISAARAQRETERLRRVVEAVQRVMRGIGVMGKDGEFVPPMTAYGDLKQALAALDTPAQPEPQEERRCGNCRRVARRVFGRHPVWWCGPLNKQVSTSTGKACPDWTRKEVG